MAADLNMRVQDVIHHVQRFTKRWPEPRRYETDATLLAQEADGGFERLLRSSLQGKLPIGDVALPREMGFGDGRRGAIVPRHELDLILRVEADLFVLEAKAWKGVVDKDSVIVFLAKLIDFMATPGYEPDLHAVRSGFISLAGFTEAARRLMFAFGVIPFSQKGAEMSSHHLDGLLHLAAADSLTSGWADLHETLVAHREALQPYLLREGRPLNQIVRIEPDVLTVDLPFLQRSSDLFTDARTAHEQALGSYREFCRRREQRHA